MGEEAVAPTVGGRQRRGKCCFSKDYPAQQQLKGSFTLTGERNTESEFCSQATFA